MKKGYSFNNIYTGLLKNKKKLLAVALLLTTLSASAATAYTWTGSADTDWGNAANWSPSAVPAGTDDAIIPSSPSGARFPVISTGTFAVGVFTIQAGASVTQTGGHLQEMKSFNNDGIFQATAGTFEFTGTAIAGTISTTALTQFYNVSFDTGADPGFSSTACYLKISGNWTNNTAVDFLSGNATTVEFNGMANQIIAGTANSYFSNLVINNTSSVVSIATDIHIIDGNVTVNAGTLDLATYTANRSTAGGTLLVSNGATLMIASDTGGETGSNFPANFSTVTLNDSSFVVYNGNSAITQTVYAVPAYGNLSLVNSSATGFAAKTAIGNIVVNGILNCASGVVLNMHANVLGGILAGVTGTGKIQTQEVSPTPIPAGKIWTGTVEYNSIGGGQSIVAGDYDNLTASGSGTKTATGVVNVYSDLTIGDAASIETSGYVTLKSIESKTARLAPVTSTVSAPISGEITVERNIPPKRAFRFLTAPVNSSTSISNNWMENAANPDRFTIINPSPGFGTNITGAGGNLNGFDVSSLNNPSCFYFDYAGQKWVPLNSTAGSFTAGLPYRILIRGDRSIDMNSNTPTPTPTTLRAKGTLATGNVVMASSGGTPGTPVLSTVLGSYNFIGNPYAAVVNWLTIDKTDIAESIYAFDPTVSGTNGLGSYVSYNSVLDANNHPDSYVDNFIQSGQGFFVETGGSNPSITFKESDKAAAQRPVFRTAASLYNISIQLLLPTMKIADATAVYYSEDYSSSIGREDSYKFTNQDENIGILRDGKTLSLEGRKPITTTDSIPLQIWQLRQNEYTLKIKRTSFTDNIQGFLKDEFLNTTTALVGTETLVPFSITADKASVSPERFKIMFQYDAALPVVLSGIKGYERNKGVQIDWTAETAQNVHFYEVEKSDDALVFRSFAIVKAKNDGHISTTYNAFDPSPQKGDNYYRIKSVEKSGDVKLSEVVTVHLAKAEPAVSVFPNPVQGNNINIVITDLSKAAYAVSLVNSTGQKVYSGNIAHRGGTENHQIKIKGKLPAGIYQLQLSTGDKVENVTVFVQ